MDVLIRLYPDKDPIAMLDDKACLDAAVELVAAHARIVGLARTVRTQQAAFLATAPDRRTAQAKSLVRSWEDRLETALREVPRV